MKIKWEKISGCFYLMAVPLAALFFTLHILPFLRGLSYSFADWKGYGSWNFSGLCGYTQMFRNLRICDAYLFTFRMALCCTALANVLSLAFACGFNAKIKGKGFLKLCISCRIFWESL
ncbi:MAG: hypothetical protein LBG43_00260 [Treponema sp.]|jgi:raffinose/stachyose/melibiose transport system permease protein|nr:hypothetical protein [Treponema sp.]